MIPTSKRFLKYKDAFDLRKKFFINLKEYYDNLDEIIKELLIAHDIQS